MEVDDQMWQPLIAGSNWKKECILSAVHNSRFKALWAVKIREQIQQALSDGGEEQLPFVLLITDDRNFTKYPVLSL